MRQFAIRQVDKSMETGIQNKIDNLNKPKGALGRLEELALKIALVQKTLSPRLSHPCHILFGADHGIEREGVSVSPREVTWQQMINFCHGGGGVNMFCRQHGFNLRIVDVGVDYDFDNVLPIINRKIAYGTRNFLYEPAMSAKEFDKAIDAGCEMVDDCYAEGCNVICFGEMGIANTSPSSVWMSLLGGIPLDSCIGAGAGLNNEGVRHKQEVLAKSVRRFHETTGISTDLAAQYSTSNIVSIIRWFGGFEMVAAIGAMLRAAEKEMIFLVDGFIMTACVLAASKIYPEILDYAIFTHCGDESGHKMMLQLMNAQPLISLGLRLGEGTGALCAYPIIVSAVNMMNEMDNFNHANITKYF